MSTIPVFYADQMNSDQIDPPLDFPRSPSGRKPAIMARALSLLCDRDRWPVRFLIPEPLITQHLKSVHSHDYVDGILSGQCRNGFGTFSPQVAESCMWTCGSMVDATINATEEIPACSLSSGFHHAGYASWIPYGYFCTFNGLVLAAVLSSVKVMIIDCDYHSGNGTENCLRIRNGRQGSNPTHFGTKPISHFSFGKYYTSPDQADEYLDALRIGGLIYNDLVSSGIRKIIYQAGADTHVDDPHGGCLTTDQMFERDKRMFTIAKELHIPIAWNLAGGYQVAPEGGINKVVDLHLNTFRAAIEVYGL